MATNVKRDFYEVLSVSRTATEQEIKSSYRKLALQFHPDRNPGNPEAEEKFKECSEAYAVLADGEKRARYDRFGHAGVAGNGPSGGGFDATVFNGFEDIFGDLFGFGEMFGQGGRRRTRAQRGGDMRDDITPSSRKLCSVSPQIQTGGWRLCDECKGDGRPGQSPINCTTCRRTRPGSLSAGLLAVARTRSNGGGMGKLIIDPCKKCKGQGRSSASARLRSRCLRALRKARVSSYSGEVREFMMDRRRPLCCAAREGALLFNVKAATLHCVIPICSPRQLGTEIQVPTPENQQKVQVPEGTQTGTVSAAGAQ